MALELKNLTLRVGAETHIHTTDLVLEDGGFNILLGTTLAGKTTLLHLMAGLEKPTSGEVWLKGRNVTGLPAQKRNVSMVHQQFINYPNFTVFENITFDRIFATIDAAFVSFRIDNLQTLPTPATIVPMPS